MPIYDYICDCGNKEAKLMPMGQGASYPCACGKTMTRVFSVPFAPRIMDSIKTRITDNLNVGLPEARNKPMLERRIMSGFNDRPVMGKGF